MSEKDEQPIIRVVKKISHGGHHGGAWKVAYADFVTAMMALFIVLWILGQAQDIKAGVGGYFRNPQGKEGMGNGPKAGQSSTLEVSKQKRAIPSLVQMDNQAVRAMEDEAEKLKDAISEEPELKGMEGQISVDVTPEGVRVEINESAEQPLFQSGSADLSPSLIEALQVLAKQYSKLPNPIVVEGHTDSAPFTNASGMTNWELSTQRANAARKILEQAGLPSDRVYMIRGYAENRPRFDNPADPKNRRISMLLLSPDGVKIAKGAYSEKSSVDPNDGPKSVIISDPLETKPKS